MRLLNISFLICAVLFVNVRIYAQAGHDKPVTIGFYNCENFFDTVDNPAKDDDEFTPRGKYRYTRKIYEQKLHNIATVLQSMSPAVIGLAEVENNAVLEALSRQPEIAGRRYRYVWYDGPDPRGINVALVYDPAIFRVLKSEPLHVDISATGGKVVTRDVLHVQGILAGETVDIFVNHWPSRRGGEDASDAKREAAARVNRNAVDALFRKNRNANIIIMGDLNDNPDDKSVATVLGAKPQPGDATSVGLFNPFASIYKTGQGTEVYKKQWNLFDQVIVSDALFNNKVLKYGYDQVYKPAFLQDTYKGYEGEPHRSFKGTHWINGYSDHFPVMVQFTTKK